MLISPTLLTMLQLPYSLQGWGSCQPGERRCRGGGQGHGWSGG